MRKVFTQIFLLGVLCCGILGGAARADDFADGVAAYNQQDYETAASAFQRARAAKPSDARATLWHGLAVYGAEGFRPAMNVWNTLSVNAYDSWGMTGNLFKGLAYWNEGDLEMAKFFLTPDVKGRGHEAVAKALKQLKAGADAPPLEQWLEGTPLVAAGGAPNNPNARNQANTRNNPVRPAPAERVIDFKKPPTAKAPVKKGGSATPPPFGRFKVGDEVLVRVSGKLWWRGKVTMVHRDKQFNGYYRIETRSGLSDYWYTHVAGLEREPYWTQFFVGTWDVKVPMAANITGEGSDTQRVWSGGMKLPPLRVNGDGTYVWTLLNKKVIKGRWIARPDAPGIILKKGEHGVDWTLYNASDKSTREVFKRDVIYLNAENHTYQEAYRAK